ncbi:Epsin-2 [Myotis brandtii]|uniref:Epsin-2 n=1 Tax=Myotis brandtii TaxID=109478 RepID=S7N2E2_MYOBR|nr:Epsin-2 [Myotis brandtii]
MAKPHGLALHKPSVHGFLDTGVWAHNSLALGSLEERLRRGDDLRLQMALEESRRDTVKVPKKQERPTEGTWDVESHEVLNRWPCVHSGAFDLFSNLNGTIKDDFSEFDNLRTSKNTAEAVASLPSQKSGTTSPDPFESQPLTVTASKPSSARKTPESFLGPNAALVNLDSLVTRPAPPAQSLNPFLAPGAAAASGPVNPFQVNQPQPLTLNQLRGSPVLGTSVSFGPGPSVEPMAVASMTSTASHPAPLGPATMNMVGSVGTPPTAAQATGTTNPFLL